MRELLIYIVLAPRSYKLQTVLCALCERRFSILLASGLFTQLFSCCEKRTVQFYSGVEFTWRRANQRHCSGRH